MEKILGIAQKYLALPQFTLYRRITNEPVKVVVVRLRDVSAPAIAAWRQYSRVDREKQLDQDPLANQIDPLQDWATVQQGQKLNLRIGLVEREQDILQGYFTVELLKSRNRWSTRIGGFLYSAPWNYAAQLGIAPFELAGLNNVFWTQTKEHDRLAIKGAGRTLTAIFLAYGYILGRHSRLHFPFKFDIDGEALDFYAKIIDLKYNWLGSIISPGKIGVSLKMKSMEKFLLRAWQEETELIS